MATGEALKRYKRAHWRACRALIDAHPDEFAELLARERRAQESAR